MIRTYIILAVLLTVAALAASLVLYPQLPAQIPTHWNIRGEVDAYGDKGWAAFLFPEIMAGSLMLAWVIPWLSPKQFEVDRFRSTYWFVVFVLSCLVGLRPWPHALGGTQGADRHTRALLAGILIMFGLIGNVMGKLRRNFWMGVRTPWTIANERVWNDTHRLAAWLFVGAALVGLLLLLLPLSLPATGITVFALIMTAALTPVVYSLVLYKRLEYRGEI